MSAVRKKFECSSSSIRDKKNSNWRRISVKQVRLEKLLDVAHDEARHVLGLLFVQLGLDLEHARHLVLELAVLPQVVDPVAGLRQLFVLLAVQPGELPLVDGLDSRHAAAELLDPLLVLLVRHRHALLLLVLYRESLFIRWCT